MIEEVIVTENHVALVRLRDDYYIIMATVDAFHSVEVKRMVKTEKTYEENAEILGRYFFKEALPLFNTRDGAYYEGDSREFILSLQEWNRNSSTKLVYISNLALYIQYEQELTVDFRIKASVSFSEFLFSKPDETLKLTKWFIQEQSSSLHLSLQKYTSYETPEVSATKALHRSLLAVNGVKEKDIMEALPLPVETEKKLTTLPQTIEALERRKAKTTEKMKSSNTQSGIKDLPPGVTPYSEGT